MQRGAVAALDDGEPFVRSMIDRAVQGRRIVMDALAPFNSVQAAPPAGAFYAFFKVEGVSDTLQAACNLIDTAGVGLAPGTAFGDGGEDFFRLCFLRDPAQVQTAMTRIGGWLRSKQRA
jgi:aspartate/methionine/tyrosine aminotransferase